MIEKRSDLKQEMFEFSVTKALESASGVNEVVLKMLNQVFELLEKAFKANDISHLLPPAHPSNTGTIEPSKSNLDILKRGQGNSREMMTMLYTIISRSPFLLSQSLTIGLLNPNNFSDLLNISLLEETLINEKSSGDLLLTDQLHPLQRKCFIPFLVPSGLVRDCRCLQSSEMACREIRPPISHRLRIDRIAFPHISEREREASYIDNCTLQWRPGGYIYQVPLNSSNKHIKNSYRQIAGPSSTTFFILKSAQFLYFSQSELEILRLALIVWMVRAGDHSFHEIMLASRDIGLEYDPNSPQKLFTQSMPSSMYEKVSRTIALDFDLVAGSIECPAQYLEHLTSSLYLSKSFI